MPTAERSGSALRVVGTPRRSLFDAVRPRQVQQAGEKLRGPGGMALAALQHQGLAGGRDGGVVLAGRTFGRAREGWVAVEDEGRALGVAYGYALTRRARTTDGPTWCLLRAVALGDGRTLEVMALLQALPAVRLVPIVVGDPPGTGRAADLLGACGLDVRRADNDDAWSVLSALDHAGHAAESTATAVVATRHVEEG